MADPKACADFPVEKVCRPGEFAEIRKAVEFGRISWPQCWERGEAIRLFVEEKPSNLAAVRSEVS